VQPYVYLISRCLCFVNNSFAIIAKEVKRLQKSFIFFLLLREKCFFSEMLCGVGSSNFLQCCFYQ
jgi:hypothetical protein